MEKAFARVEELADTIKEYVNTRIESVKLSAAEKSSALIANVMAGVIVAVVFLLFIIFASIALSFGLGEWIGKTWVGFLIVAFLYLFIGIVVWVGRGKIIRLPIMNALIRQLFRNDEDNEDYEKD
ncbi:MAG TPA: phage holin family protein [Chitinophagaceae bacterium]